MWAVGQAGEPPHLLDAEAHGPNSVTRPRVCLKGIHCNYLKGIEKKPLFLKSLGNNSDDLAFIT